MNRPKKEDYIAHVKSPFMWELLAYVEDLEKYCDYIVSKGDCCSHYEKKIQELENGIKEKEAQLIECNKLNSVNARRLLIYEKALGYAIQDLIPFTIYLHQITVDEMCLNYIAKVIDDEKIKLKG